LKAYTEKTYALLISSPAESERATSDACGNPQGNILLHSLDGRLGGCIGLEGSEKNKTLTSVTNPPLSNLKNERKKLIFN